MPNSDDLLSLSAFLTQATYGFLGELPKTVIGCAIGHKMNLHRTPAFRRMSMKDVRGDQISNASISESPSSSLRAPPSRKEEDRGTLCTFISRFSFCRHQRSICLVQPVSTTSTDTSASGEYASWDIGGESSRNFQAAAGAHIR